VKRSELIRREERGARLSLEAAYRQIDAIQDIKYSFLSTQRGRMSIEHITRGRLLVTADVDAVTVWGGGDKVPPEFTKIF
jgi:hypothetical protein